MIEDDPALVALARGGDRAAFDELVRRHGAGLYAVVVRLCTDAHEAEEVTQDAFLRAWRGLPAFRGDAQFFTWLYRIGVNEARRRTERQHRRAEARLVSLDEHREHESPDRSIRPADRAEQSELRRVLDHAISALPVEQRAALVLRDVEGLSTAQAASALGLNEAAFKSRLHRARETLRTALADDAGQRGSL
ncbi:MAG: sigma-70 family RNA polymerase sigma factor [Actinomycetota bacterium]|nr:sigma-70 family RNA polymerase sigma factor [Actinomycetota bacterium]